MTENLKEMLVRHEGVRLKPYLDTVGKLTIGIGRNLNDVGISREEAFFLFQNDLVHKIAELRSVFPWFDRLDDVRQDVVIDMGFNMGIARLAGFKRTIRMIEDEDWEGASIEMLDSKWSRQVGRRAIELANMMKTGSY